MNNTSKILGESNLSFEEFVYYMDGWIITNVINWNNPFPYFKLYIGDKNNISGATDIADENKTPMCRISMINSNYVNAEGETLILNKEQKEKLIEILNSIDEESDESLWKLLIENYNYFHNCCDDKNVTKEMISNFKEISLDLPIPDYTKLPDRD